MDYCLNIQKSIDYMEQHLKDEIDLPTAIKQSGYSITHFYRIFQALFGVSVKDYIRNRRLSEAAVELCASKKRIIEIAIEYGFQSQEVFTRAFIRLFHIPPGEYRKKQNKVILYEKVNAYQNMLDHAEAAVTPQIIYHKEFLIVGMKKRVKPKDKQITYLWRDFNQKKHELDGTHNKDKLLGICEYMPDITDEDEFDYVAGIEVSRYDTIPEGMQKKSLPPSKYAVFTKSEGMSRLKEFYNNIYAGWLPQSGYELAESDTIEVYYTGEDHANRMDIFIPIK